MARSPALGVDSIISQGLEEGGNPGLTTLARTFLTLFLDQLAAAYDWPWLLEEESFSIAKGAKSIDVSGLSSTYRAVKSIHLDGKTASPDELWEWKNGFLDLRRRIRNDDENGSDGEPRHFFPDPKGDKIWIWPIADKAYTGVIWYYKQPSAPSYNQTPEEDPWVPDSSIAVAAVADFAARYDRDTFERILNQNVKLAKIALRANMNDHGRQRQDTFEFDKTVHNWRRIV